MTTSTATQRPTYTGPCPHCDGEGTKIVAGMHFPVHCRVCGTPRPDPRNQGRWVFRSTGTLRTDDTTKITAKPYYLPITDTQGRSRDLGTRIDPAARCGHPKCFCERDTRGEDFLSADTWHSRIDAAL